MKLTINQNVYEVLGENFPNTNIAKVLGKYELLLNQQLASSIIYRNEFDYKFNLHRISLSDLQNKSPKITGNRINLHRWLLDNCALFTVSELGNPFDQVLSQIKFNDNVTIKEDAMVGPTEKQRRDFIDFYYPRMLEDSVDIDQEFDLLAIDIRSLLAYEQALNNFIYKSTQQIEIERQIISFIKKCYEIFDGYWPQQKKHSPFGRIYYHGTSIQSINRELRSAVLGDCYEYDLNSSVLSWKMAWRDEPMPMTEIYLNSRQDFIKTIRADVFNSADERFANRDFQLKLVKQALTAMSFGARLTSNGYVNEQGNWTESAMSDIFRNRDIREKFVNSEYIQAFSQEQQKLNTKICQYFLDVDPELADQNFLLSDTNRLNRNKLMAFLYQQSETKIIDLVVKILTANGIQIKARIHDAIFTDRPWGELKNEIELGLQELYKNPYLKFTKTSIEKYSHYDQSEELAHRERMALEQARAEQIYGKSPKLVKVVEEYDPIHGWTIKGV